MTDHDPHESLNTDHILAWLDFLHADVQSRLFEHQHRALHPELGDPLTKFASRFGPKTGIPISFTNERTAAVDKAYVRAWTDYRRAIEAVRLLTQVCFTEDGAEMKALYEKALPSVIKAAQKSGIRFGIGQIRGGHGAGPASPDTQPEWPVS